MTDAGREQSDWHPAWCARDHACTAPVGEHRSDPLTWRADHGLFIATRVRKGDGRQQLEVRVVIELPGDEEEARVQARRLAANIDLSVYAALATPAE
jgi:hypothetical protein